MTDAEPNAKPPTHAKPPRRRLFRRALKYTAAVIALLAIAYAGLCVWYYRQTPKLARNFTAELNAPTLKIPPENRAWTHYRRALEVLERRQENEFAHRPSEKNWPQTVAYLKRNAKAIEMLREAAKIRPMGILYQDGVDPADVAWQVRHGELHPDNAGDPPQPSENPFLMALKFTHLSTELNIASLFQSDAHLAASENDEGRLVANLYAMFDLGEQALEAPFLVDHLVAITIEGMAVADADRHLANSPATFSDDALHALERRLHDLAKRRHSPAIRMNGERLIWMDMIQRIYTDDGQGDGVFTIDGDFGNEEPGSDDGDDLTTRIWDRFRAPIWAAFVMPRRRELEAATQAHYDDVDRAMRIPLWQEVTPPVGDSPYEAELTSWKSYLSVGTGSDETFRDTQALHRQEISAAIVALALVRHHRIHNQYPNALADLAPGLLREDTVDQFTGKPLLYKLVDNRPTVYSVGADLDDDGGQPPEGNPAPYRSGVRNFGDENPPNGDWILWPPHEEEEVPVPDQSNDDVQANQEADAPATPNPEPASN